LSATRIPVSVFHGVHNLPANKVIVGLTGSYAERCDGDALFSLAQDIERLGKVRVGVHVDRVGLPGTEVLIFELKGRVGYQPRLAFESAGSGHALRFRLQSGA
jgi:hypothetical protein